MNREQTLEAIKVMQHFADGGEVEIYDLDGWRVIASPGWEWNIREYRIAKPAPKKVKFLAYIGPLGSLIWVTESHPTQHDWKRVPSADRVEEVAE